MPLENFGKEVALIMDDLLGSLHKAIWDKHFANDKISGVTWQECWLLAENVMEELRNVGIVPKTRP